jgi:hypothetical protein
MLDSPDTPADDPVNLFDAVAAARRFGPAAELVAAARAFVAPYDAQLRYAAADRNEDYVRITIAPRIATAVLAFRAALDRAGA